MSLNIHFAYLKPVLFPVGEPIAVSKYFLIGSDKDCHHVIQGESTAPRHAVIEKVESDFVVRDLSGPAAGTFVNGVRILTAILQGGDLLAVGGHQFVFHLNDRPQELVLPSWMKTENEEWRNMLRGLPKMAVSELPVLVSGESGCGKELISRALHDFSGRFEQPFVSINCSALSESLAESELFGHVKGSFTGALSDRKGAFEAARGGTLFLDEIGDLPLSMQPKILRALENNEIRPVGSDQTVRIDVRIIAATHKNIHQQIRQGLFRSDLYYRLSVLTIAPPSLRDRMEDFDSILYGFARGFRVRYSHEAISRMKKHTWPGNIRELKNFVAKTSVIFADEYIQPQHVEQLLGLKPLKLLERVHTKEQSSVLKEIEKELIVQRLTANSGNQRKTAQDLGIPKSTLHDRIKNYRINTRRLTDLCPASGF